MSEEKKVTFPCRKCHKDISVSRTDVEDSIRANGNFECPHCQAKNTKSADLYTRMLIEV